MVQQTELGLTVHPYRLYGQPLFPNVRHLTVTVLKEMKAVAGGRYSAFELPDAMVFDSIDLCLKGDETEMISLLVPLRAREYRSTSIHLPNTGILTHSPHSQWNACTFYDTQPRHNLALLPRLESSLPFGITYFVFGAPQWRDGWLSYLERHDWRPSPTNKIQLEWFDSADDPACPPCKVCGAYGP